MRKFYGNRFQCILYPLNWTTFYGRKLFLIFIPFFTFATESVQQIMEVIINCNINYPQIVLRRYEDRCPRYDELYNWYVKESPAFHAMNKKYDHLFEYWEEKNGKSVEDIEDAFLMYKKYLDRKRQNRTLVTICLPHL